MTAFRLPLRRYLFLLVIAGVLPLAALCGIGLAVLYAQLRDDTLRYAREITRALATAVDSELQSSLSALQVLAAAPVLRSREYERFLELARRAKASQPAWVGLHVSSPAGQRLFDTVGTGDKTPAPLAESASHEEVVRTREPRVGALARGLYGHAFALRAPVVVDGEVHYVVNAIVDPAAMRRVIERQNVPAEWVISVFDARGARVARSRAHEQFVGTPASPSLRELMATPAQEGAGLTRALEGDPVFTAFSRLPSGWSVAIGIPVASVNHAAGRTIAIYAAAVVVSILLGMLAAWWLARRASLSMERLRQAALALGRGERPEPVETEIAEVHDVDAALTASAAQRRVIEAEREELLHREQAARAEAESANLAKDQFLAMLAHELRNPLAAISNASALLEDERARPEIQVKAREVIRRQSHHLGRLTDDLLDAARALLGKVQLQPRAVDLAAIASQTVRTLATSGKAVGHRVDEALEEAWVDGDPVRLDQVVSNLLENAIKYTPAGGTITVRVRREGGESVLSVTDTGVGLNPELAQRVFDLFVQGKRGIDRRQGGLGIGLTLVKRLAELHGGSVAVSSAGENRGSQFTLRLPAIDRPAAGDGPLKPTDTVSRSLLVVEDNDDARETLVTLLEMAGHRVESARDGVIGLEKALALSPDVGIIDIGLPGIDGMEFARRLRAAGERRIYLVALTGYGSDQDRERVLAAGFDAHLTKPADISVLGALIAGASVGAPAVP